MPLPSKKPKRYIHTVFIHYTASESRNYDQVEEIRKDHMENRGWDDIGYHFVITEHGEIQTGRDIEKIPAAQKGKNTGSIAIALAGKNTFTTEQTESLQYACERLNDLYGGVLRFRGHGEVNNTKCPGPLNYRAILGLNKDGYISTPRKNLSESRTIKGGKIAGGAIGGAAVLEIMDKITEYGEKAAALGGILKRLIEYGPLVFSFIAAAGVAYMIYARIDDNVRGIR